MRVHRDGQAGVRPSGRRLALALAALLLAGGVVRAEEPLAAPPEAALASPEGAAPEGVDVAAPAIPLANGPGAAPPEESAVERAWRAPAENLEERAERTRRAALEVGAWNLDPAARALIRGASEGTPLERATAAVQLAPDLPASHLALARALWIYENDAMAAIVAVVDGVRAIGHHPEASLWFAGSGLYVTAVALLAASLLMLVLSVVLPAPHAAHDIAHLLKVRVPPFAGFALLATLLLLPLVLGEGVLGLACVLIPIGMLYGNGARRFALLLAALGLFAGLYTLPQLAAATLAAFPEDPVARAAYTTGQGQASPVDLARLRRAAADDDPLAVRALAIHARQVGNLGQADAYYQRLLKDSPNDLALINNAANVRLDLGHVDSALDLYDRALELAGSPVVLFNLSQAYGRAFQVDELNRTLAEAQQADGELVAEFTSLQRTKNQSFVVDFPLGTRQMWRRVLDHPRGDSLARSFRHPLAPGRLGASPAAGGLALALGVGLAWLLALRFEPSRACVRCGSRQCGRCGDAGAQELCESCNRLFFEPEKTDRRLRVERIEALRERERRMGRLRTLLSVLVPGAAGLLARRPLRGLLGAFCFALAACAVVWRGGVVPDPLLAGPAAGVVFLGSAGVCAFLYIASVASSLAAGREM
jgi:tetratricopeptide (TPR) repeat protein